MKNNKKSEDSTQYMPIGMSVGLALGAGVGAATGNIPVWMALGMSIGMSAGMLIDRQKRKEATNHNEDENEE